MSGAILGNHFNKSNVSNHKSISSNRMNSNPKNNENNGGKKS